MSAAHDALDAAAAELHELRTENMRLRHQARETVAIHDRLAAELVTVQGSVDRLLAQCVRQRALFDDLRACPTTIAVPRLIATSDDVNSWPFVVEVPRATWDALHAIGGEVVMCASVAEMARAAWEAAEEARRQKRAEDDARRAAESSALDAEMLEMVYGHDWIVNNLPGVEFVLVDRRFPQCTAVVHPVDEDDVLLIVTEGRSYVQWAPPRNRPAREPMWLVGARQCDTLADVGCAIHDWQRQQEAEDE